MNFNHLLSLDRRYTKTESEIFRYQRFSGATPKKAGNQKPPEGGNPSGGF